MNELNASRLVSLYLELTSEFNLLLIFRRLNLEMNQHQNNFPEKILQLSLFEQRIKYKKLPQVWENKISIRFTFMTQKNQLKIHPFQTILEIAFHLKTNRISIANEETCQDIL